MIIPVVESNIILHKVPIATGAIMVGIKNIDVAIFAHILSEHSAIATKSPTITSNATEIIAKNNVFNVLVLTVSSVSILI